MAADDTFLWSTFSCKHTMQFFTQKLKFWMMYHSIILVNIDIYKNIYKIYLLYYIEVLLKKSNFVSCL